jgi:putative nucleotidyltransferase with HDIG domain
MSESVHNPFDKIIKTLQVSSPVIGNILSVVSSPQSSAAKLEAALRHDPMIAARVLRCANSAFFGISGGVSSLRNAVVLLGFDKIRSIAVLSSLKSLPGNRSIPSRFWSHSAAVAITAETIARHMQRYEEFDTDEIFCGSLLHDIGMVVIEAADPGYLHRTLQICRRDSVSFDCAENGEWAHTTAGVCLAQAWRFPDLLATIIHGHHNPDPSSPSYFQCAIVHVADSMMQMVGYGIGQGTTGPEIKTEALARLNMSPESLRLIAERAIDEGKKVEELAGVLS